MAAATSQAPNFQELIQPVPPGAHFSDPQYNIWGASMIQGEDKRYHLFYSRWPANLGHNAWVTHSEIARAVADDPLGPYRHAEIVLPPRGKAYWDGLCTHNPTILRFGKKYYLYYMGNTGDGVPKSSLNWTHRNNQRIGVAVADSPAGPWERMDAPLIDTTPGFHDELCLANPSVLERFEGGYLMVYKGVAAKGKHPFGGPVVHVVAMSNSPTGPFVKHLEPVFTSADSSFAAEDPFVWRGMDRYWAIVKDNDGRFTHRGYSLALWESKDAIQWQLAKHSFVANPSFIRWADGRRDALTTLERPQLYCANGKPVVLFCAAANNKQRDGSFNIHIPLTVQQ